MSVFYQCDWCLGMSKRLVNWRTIAHGDLLDRIGGARISWG